MRSMADKLRHFLHVAGVQGISVAALWLINEVLTYISVEIEGRRENRILHK